MDVREKRQNIGHLLTVATKVPNGEAATLGAKRFISYEMSALGVDISAPVPGLALGGTLGTGSSEWLRTGVIFGPSRLETLDKSAHRLPIHGRV